jgi:phosphoadenosine phosphosulfate reductase
MTTTTAHDAATAAALGERFANATAQEVIAWASAEYPGQLAVSCSFGGPSGIVLVDLAMQVDRSLPIVYVDTDYLFLETYATAKAVEERYGARVLAFRSALSPRTQELLHGPALWERDADLCCSLRKVAPMREALLGFSAYLTGLRRDQSDTRTSTPLVQWDEKFGLLKINPLAAWTEREIWSYIVANGLPYNPLHDRGYPSIGCTNCTRAVAPGEDPRAGRWSGSDKIECGLHTA